MKIVYLEPIVARPDATPRDLGVNQTDIYEIGQTFDRAFKKGARVRLVSSEDSKSIPTFKNVFTGKQGRIPLACLARAEAHEAKKTVRTEITWETLEVEDQLKCREDDQNITIVDFGKAKNIVFFKTTNGICSWLEKQTLVERYDIVQPPIPEPPTEMTQEEIEAVLGKKVKIVESKQV